MNPRPSAREAALDPLRNEADHLHQLDRAATAVAERRVMEELRRLTPRGDVFERHVLDEEERPGSELLRQALDGRLDALDHVGVVVCFPEWRSKKILRHDSLLGLVDVSGVAAFRPWGAQPGGTPRTASTAPASGPGSARRACARRRPRFRRPQSGAASRSPRRTGPRRGRYRLTD